VIWAGVLNPKRFRGVNESDSVYVRKMLMTSKQVEVTRGAFFHPN